MGTKKKGIAILEQLKAYRMRSRRDKEITEGEKPYWAKEQKKDFDNRKK